MSEVKEGETVGERGARPALVPEGRDGDGAGGAKAEPRGGGAVPRSREPGEAGGPRESDEAGEARASNFHPLAELTKVRLREFLREKEAVFWVFVFPVLLACALGIAFRNTAPEKARVAVEAGETEQSRAVAAEVSAALSRSPDVEPLVFNSEESAQALRTGNVALVVRPAPETSPAGEAAAGRDGATGAGAGRMREDEGGAASSLAGTRFTYRFDPTRPESRAAQLAADAALGRALGQADPIAAEEERVSEPGGRYIDFLIPGLIGLNLMGSGMWGIGFSIVTSRGRGLLRLFAATPMRRSHYLLSFILSRLVFLLLEVGALLLFGWLAFGVAVRGPVALVFAIALVGGMAFAGIGLLVAARPKTVEGVSGLMNFVMLPMWLLSGTFFSSERFPEVLQPAIKALPLTAVNDSLRAVINEGASPGAVWVPLAVLVAWGLVGFAGALKLFRWQ